jgi:hypothetical protein
VLTVTWSTSQTSLRDNSRGDAVGADERRSILVRTSSTALAAALETISSKSSRSRMIAFTMIGALGWLNAGRCLTTELSLECIGDRLSAE